VESDLVAQLPNSSSESAIGESLPSWTRRQSILQHLLEICLKDSDWAGGDVVVIDVDRNAINLSDATATIAKAVAWIEDRGARGHHQLCDLLSQIRKCFVCGYADQADSGEHGVSDLEIGDPFIVRGEWQTYDDGLTLRPQLMNIIGQIQEEQAAKLLH
jgi:hypothetical protein